MRKRLLPNLIIQAVILLLTTNMLAFASVQAAPVEAPSASAGDVIAAINNYRVQNGLPALTTNPMLSSLAQAQSNYQASIESVTHTGPGGTSPQDRASAAGYGNGEGFYYSEIIYGGYNATSSDAMSWWKNSSTHNYYILQNTYVEIGAGIATSGNMTYFTAVLAGMYSGGAASSSTGSQSENTDASNESSSQPAVPLVMPVQKATPGADGSITHIVREGQTLWTVAAVYEVDLDYLLELNNLNRFSFVFPGDELVVQPPGSFSTADPASATQTPGPESTSQTDSSSKPKILGTPVAYNTKPQATNTPIVISIPSDAIEASEEQTATSTRELIPQNSTIRLLLIIAFSILFLVVIGSIFLQKSPDEDDPKS